MRFKAFALALFRTSYLYLLISFAIPRFYDVCPLSLCILIKTYIILLIGNTYLGLQPGSCVLNWIINDIFLKQLYSDINQKSNPDWECKRFCDCGQFCASSKSFYGVLLHQGLDVVKGKTFNIFLKVYKLNNDFYLSLNRLLNAATCSWQLLVCRWK